LRGGDGLRLREEKDGDLRRLLGDRERDVSEREIDRERFSPREVDLLLAFLTPLLTGEMELLGNLFRLTSGDLELEADLGLPWATLSLRYGSGDLDLEGDLEIGRGIDRERDLLLALAVRSPLLGVI
jgi:hypothetical protein